MKKILVFTLVVLALVLASAMAVSLAHAEIVSADWLGSFHSWDTDIYYGASVYGYEENSKATLLVGVRNDLPSPRRMNVSRIIVGFDWSVNYTTRLPEPVELRSGETRFFTVTITLPNTTVASNLYLHSYTVYVVHVNAAGMPVGTLTYHSDLATPFAVYSKDQADAREMGRVISGIPSPAGGFNSTAANLLLAKAVNETSIGNILYTQGDFAGAKTHYSKALNLINQAFATEQTTTGGIQDAQLALVEAQAKSFEAQANYLNGMSSMWVLIGVAAVLFALGYLLRGLAVMRRVLAPS